MSIRRERSIGRREFHKRGTRQMNELHSAGEEKGIRFNLEDS